MNNPNKINGGIESHLFSQEVILNFQNHLIWFSWKEFGRNCSTIEPPWWRMIERGSILHARAAPKMEIVTHSILSCVASVFERKHALRKNVAWECNFSKAYLVRLNRKPKHIKGGTYVAYFGTGNKKFPLFLRLTHHSSLVGSDLPLPYISCIYIINWQLLRNFQGRSSLS